MNRYPNNDDDHNDDDGGNNDDNNNNMNENNDDHNDDGGGDDNDNNDNDNNDNDNDDDNDDDDDDDDDDNDNDNWEQGGYEVSIEDHAAVFDGAYVTLSISIPHRYRRSPIDLLHNERNNLIQLIRGEMARENIEHFGLSFQFEIRAIYQTPNNPDRSDTLYLNSRRYVTTLTDLNDVFDAILQHFIDKFSEILTRQEGSGFIINKITQFNINYHKCVAYIRPGNRIKFPMQRGAYSIFNPLI